MAELVADCPRCGAKHVTFDIRGSLVSPESSYELEAFGRCRGCRQGTIFVLFMKTLNGKTLHALRTTPLTSFDGDSLNSILGVKGYVSIKNLAAAQPPKYVPPKVEAAFREGATCLAVQCWNAAAAMFRLCVDLATKKILAELPAEERSKAEKKMLGGRLNWMFENGHLSDDLEDLASCIREDGNDGAHDGSLDEATAKDLLGFSRVLLERLYTGPEKLRLAQKQRDERRAELKS